MPLAVSVTVPATSANLGPGFDCLGLALNLYLEVTAEIGSAGLHIATNEPDLPTDASNLVYLALTLVFEAAGKPQPEGLQMDIHNGIPLSRGLGSSAAAIAAGLLLGNELARARFDHLRLLEVGLPLEGHPDNLAPALFGGLQVSSLEEGRVLSVGVDLPKLPSIALYIPDFLMSTSDARRVLPASVPRADAIFNTGRSSLLVAALARGQLEVLRWAMDDRLHQPYRASIFPPLPHLIKAALDAGAAGAAMSGAGSAVIALCDSDPTPIVAALEQAAGAAGLTGRGLSAEIDLQGGRVGS